MNKIIKSITLLLYTLATIDSVSGQLIIETIETAVSPATTQLIRDNPELNLFGVALGSTDTLTIEGTTTTVKSTDLYWYATLNGKEISQLEFYKVVENEERYKEGTEIIAQINRNIRDEFEKNHIKRLEKEIWDPTYEYWNNTREGQVYKALIPDSPEYQYSSGDKWREGFWPTLYGSIVMGGGIAGVIGTVIAKNNIDYVSLTLNAVQALSITGIIGGAIATTIGIITFVEYDKKNTTAANNRTEFFKDLPIPAEAYPEMLSEIPINLVSANSATELARLYNDRNNRR